MYVEQDIELQKQKASLITNIELLENQRKIGILDRDKEKNNKTDNPLSPQTSERSRKRVAQWNRNCNFF